MVITCIHAEHALIAVLIIIGRGWLDYLQSHLRLCSGAHVRAQLGTGEEPSTRTSPAHVLNAELGGMIQF